MYRPAENNGIFHAGGARALFSLFSCLVGGKGHKAVQSLFADERFAVLLDTDAVIDFIGEDFGSVLFEVCLDEFLRFVLCFEI